MKWACRRDKTNAAFWIAVMVATLSPTWAAPHAHHHWNAWVTGFLIGLVFTVTVGLVALRNRRRCA